MSGTISISKNKAFEVLARKAIYDNNKDLTNAFLLMYKGFQTPDQDLVSFWHERLGVAAAYRDKNPEDELLLLDFMRLWLASYPYDLSQAERDSVLHRLEQFYPEHVVSEFKELANKASDCKSIFDIASSKSESEYGHNPTRLGQTDFLFTFHPFDFPPELIYRELVRIEVELFKRIQSREFLNQGWQHKDDTMKSILAPNITRFINRFNEVSYWVATEILMQPTVDVQAALVEKFITVAKLSLQRCNFSTMMEMLSGLSNVAVQRLRAVWRKVSSSSKQQMQLMEEMMRPMNNFKDYRQYFALQSHPKMPHFPLILRDITFSNEGNPTYLANGSVNVDRLLLINQHVLAVRQLQAQCDGLLEGELFERKFGVKDNRFATVELKEKRPRKNRSGSGIHERKDKKESKEKKEKKEKKDKKDKKHSKGNPNNNNNNKTWTREERLRFFFWHLPHISNDNVLYELSLQAQPSRASVSLGNGSSNPLEQMTQSCSEIPALSLKRISSSSNSSSSSGSSSTSESESPPSSGKRDPTRRLSQRLNPIFGAALESLRNLRSADSDSDSSSSSSSSQVYEGSQSARSAHSTPKVQSKRASRSFSVGSKSSSRDRDVILSLELEPSPDGPREIVADTTTTSNKPVVELIPIPPRPANMPAPKHRPSSRTHPIINAAAKSSPELFKSAPAEIKVSKQESFKQTSAVVSDSPSKKLTKGQPKKQQPTNPDSSPYAFLGNDSGSFVITRKKGSVIKKTILSELPEDQSATTKPDPLSRDFSETSEACSTAAFVDASVVENGSAAQPTAPKRRPLLITAEQAALAAASASALLDSSASSAVATTTTYASSGAEESGDVATRLYGSQEEVQRVQKLKKKAEKELEVLIRRVDVVHEDETCKGSKRKQKKDKSKKKSKKEDEKEKKKDKKEKKAKSVRKTKKEDGPCKGSERKNKKDKSSSSKRFTKESEAEAKETSKAKKDKADKIVKQPKAPEKESIREGKDKRHSNLRSRGAGAANDNDNNDNGAPFPGIPLHTQETDSRRGSKREHQRAQVLMMMTRGDSKRHSRSLPELPMLSPQRSSSSTSSPSWGKAKEAERDEVDEEEPINTLVLEPKRIAEQMKKKEKKEKKEKEQQGIECGGVEAARRLRIIKRKNGSHFDEQKQKQCSTVACCNKNNGDEQLLAALVSVDTV